MAHVNDNRNEQIFRNLPWSQVKVGQIWKIQCDEFFPADIILLGSSLPQGIWYIETKNLDGETNMKHKAAHKFTAAWVENDEDAFHFNGRISCQGPNEYLYKFEGNLAFEPDKRRIEDDNFKGGPTQVPLDANQMLLRGSSLRNTDFAYGVVVYTGHESKIMKNSPSSRLKRSKIELKTNTFILFTFAFQVAIWLFASVYSAIWNNAFKSRTDTYLAWGVRSNAVSNSVFLTFLVSLGTWLLIFW